MKYAFLWWTNLYAKQTRNKQGKIRTWEKMKSKLKSQFLHTTYVQESYFQLRNLT